MGEANDIPVSAQAGDNSLPDLAHRIRAEHEALAVALKDSVRHAIAAGELLIEAKAKLGHGQCCRGSAIIARSRNGRHCQGK